MSRIPSNTTQTALRAARFLIYSWITVASSVKIEYNSKENNIKSDDRERVTACRLKERAVRKRLRDCLGKCSVRSASQRISVVVILVPIAVRDKGKAEYRGTCASLRRISGGKCFLSSSKVEPRSTFVFVDECAFYFMTRY